MNGPLELNWLKYFYEVAKVSSVTQGARALRISQPAVSKMIHQLEESLGVHLLEKRGRNVILTEEGSKLFLVCQNIFNEVKSIQEIQKNSTQTLKDEIKLGASDHLCSYVLPKMISKFTQQNPGVRWELFSGVSSEIKSKLISGELDAGIFYTKLNLKEQRVLSEQKLGEVRFSIVASPHLLRKKAITLLEFKKRKFTYIGARTADYAGTPAEQWVTNKFSLNTDVLLQANTKESQKELILAGAGFGVIPTLMIEKELKNGSLVEVRVPAPINYDVLWVENKAAKKRRAIEQFKNYSIVPYFQK